MYKKALEAEKFKQKLSVAREVKNLADANLYLSWNMPNAKIQIADKIVLLERIEDVVWGEYKSNRKNWPISKTVSYSAKVINDNYKLEKEIAFSRIRNWEAKLLKEII
jgi:hypothetical protein